MYNCDQLFPINILRNIIIISDLQLYSITQGEAVD